MSSTAGNTSTGKMRQAPAATTEEQWFASKAKREQEKLEEERRKKEEEEKRSGVNLKPDVENILVHGEIVTVSTAKNEVAVADNKVHVNFVENYHGSSAAAGSDFFAAYHKTRRMEMDRIEDMEKSHTDKQQTLTFQQKRIENFQKDQAKLEKNRKKRDKKKQAALRKRERCAKGGGENDEDSGSDENGNRGANSGNLTGNVNPANTKFRKIDSTNTSGAQSSAVGTALEQKDASGFFLPTGGMISTGGSRTTGGSSASMGPPSANIKSKSAAVKVRDLVPDKPASATDDLDFGELAAQVNATSAASKVDSFDEESGGTNVLTAAERMKKQNIFVREDIDF
ncbi:unnamed protein product [Amoebophrya sp. A120]|nr:unnamed protein product [Amoebophrya sp. A120]|eukprot:GSA120T00009133001.1